MGSSPQSADRAWRLGLVGRVALLVGLLVAVVAMVRGPRVPPVVVPPEPVAGVDDEADGDYRVEVEDKVSEFTGPPTLREQRRRMRGTWVNTDVQLSLHITAAGVWVVRELGGVFSCCTGRCFSRVNWRLCGDDDRKCLEAAHASVAFWHGPGDTSIAVWPPAARLQATLLAELAAGPPDKVVRLVLSAPDGLPFGAIWPFEEVARRLMAGPGQDGALLLEYQDGNVLRTDGLRDWQVAGHAPPGYSVE